MNSTYGELSLPPLICSSLMLICCVIGLPGNLISASIFYRMSQRSPINVLLFSLSIFDFALLLFSSPVMILPSLNVHMKIDWVDRLYPYTLIVCYPISMIIQSCSMWTFVLISLERYFAVCKPFQLRKWCTISRTKLAQLLVIIISVFANLIRFWEYRIDHNSTKGYHRLLRDNYLYFTLYHLVLHLITHFLLPFMFISFLGANILHTMTRTGTIASMARNNSSFLINANRRALSQRRTTRMVTVVTSMFIACNFLPFLINVWEVIDFDLFHGPYRFLAFPLIDAANTLVFLNSSTTFIFYWIYCQKYRIIFIRDMIKISKIRCCLWNVPSITTIGSGSESPANVGQGGPAGPCGPGRFRHSSTGLLNPVTPVRPSTVSAHFAPFHHDDEERTVDYELKQNNQMQLKVSLLRVDKCGRTNETEMSPD